MIDPSIQELTAGLQAILTQLLNDAKDEVAFDVVPTAQELATQAALWSQRALLGDPDAEKELTLVQARAEFLAARVTRKGQAELVDGIMTAFGLVTKFLVAAAMAA